MKKRLVLLFIALPVCWASLAQPAVKASKTPDPSRPLQITEASCGQCQFGLKGKGCTLAVRLNGKPYFVKGTTIDEHGDAHDKEGFCNAIRKAEVQGELVKDRFVVSYFKLLPLDPAAK